MTVHVFAPPDADEPDARLCSDEDLSETVVYHTASECTECGKWFCRDCETYESDLSDDDVVVCRVL